MTVADARLLPDGAELTHEICIVGAGASGITLALQLENSGIDCCVLESGDVKQDEDTQSLYDLESVGYPLRENFMSRARYFGGSCNIWAGRAMRLCPLDFEKRDWVPDSGWPITYQDIEPFYRRAERLLRLPSFVSSDDAGVYRGCSDHEQKVFENSDIYATAAIWGIKPMRFGKVFGKAIRRSNAISLYLNANVTELVASDSGNSVKHLVVRTLNQKQLTVTAETIVLAAGGLENARLMLNSRSQHSDGFGNQRDLVGRYYLDHPRAIFGRVHVNESVSLPSLTGLPLSDGKIQFGLAMSARLQKEHGLVNTYASLEPQMSEFAEKQYGRSINAAKVLLRRGHVGSRIKFTKSDDASLREMIYLLTPKEIMPHFIYRPYAWLKRLVRHRRKLSKLTIINFCEQSPNPNSRVQLSDSEDKLGMKTLTLDWRIDDDVYRSIRYLQKTLRSCIEGTGIGRLEADFDEIKDLSFTDASHHMGTTRMSISSQSGVVNADCKVHGVSNLFVASSSVFPTVGHANPTLTILALAIRLGDHLTANRGV